MLGVARWHSFRNIITCCRECGASKGKCEVSLRIMRGHCVSQAIRGRGGAQRGRTDGDHSSDREMIKRFLVGFLFIALVAPQAAAVSSFSCAGTSNESRSKLACCCAPSPAEQTCSFGCSDGQTKRDLSALPAPRSNSKISVAALAETVPADHNTLSSGPSKTLAWWADGPAHAPPHKKYLLNCTFLC